MAVKREAPLSWRPPREMRERLEVMAGDRGVSLGALIQELVERGLSIGTVVVAEPKRPVAAQKAVPAPKPAKPAKAQARRTEVCAHRLPPETYCKRGCD